MTTGRNSYPVVSTAADLRAYLAQDKNCRRKVRFRAIYAAVTDLDGTLGSYDSYVNAAQAGRFRTVTSLVDKSAFMDIELGARQYWTPANVALFDVAVAAAAENLATITIIEEG